jgi:hypothetical protein
MHPRSATIPAKQMYERILRVLLILCTLAGSTCARAVEDNPGAWAVLSASGGLGQDSSDNPWRYWFDAQYRAFDIGSGVSQLLVRPAIGLNLRQGVSIWAGYAYVDTRSAAGRRIDEHRPWQQLSWTAFSGARSKLGLRLRLEQRFLESGDDTGWVFRAQARYAHRLDENGHWQAVGFIEPFLALNDTDWGAEHGLAQHRVFLGAAYGINAAVSIEFGYMNQYIKRSGDDLANHLAVAHLKLRR